ncbi:MAG: DUF1853 family protein [Proteobacteria bacterium]|nr:DUF1853 family protein [Pseudomonadota bacterium]
MINRSEYKDEIHLAVRDLEWIVTAPFMLAEDPEPNLADLPETKTLLLELQQDPSPLLSHLESLNRHTLGSYFEHLVIFWLSKLPPVTLLATNLQVFDGKTTIGEFDLLFTYQNICYHWELAIKFYLNIGTGTQEVDFVGPKRQDNLDRKLARLFDHQLQLGKKAEAQSKLQKLGAKDIHAHAWVKGVLFQPVSGGQDFTISLPDRVSKNCPQGQWIRLKELNQAKLPEFEHFLRPSKPNWLASRYYQNEALSGGKKALRSIAKETLTKKEEPLLIYLLKMEGPSELRVIERLFVVPDCWSL